MNEAEWLAASDPAEMLPSLRGRITDRRLWLFAAACDRRVLPLVHLQTNQEGQRQFRGAVDLLERLAKGAATEEDLQRLNPLDTLDRAWSSATIAALNAAESVAIDIVSKKRFSNRTAERRSGARGAAHRAARTAEQPAQCDRAARQAALDGHPDNGYKVFNGRHSP